MQDLLNFTNAEGEVITLFDGKLTLSQAIGILAALAVIIFAFKVLKAAARTTVCVIAVCACLIHFNLASPTQIKDVATQVAQAGISGYQSAVDSSKNIRWENNTIQINLDDNWVNVSDIESIIGGESGKATVVAGGVSYVVDDSAVIKLLKTFT